MATEIVEYSKTEAALAVLAQQYQGVIYDVSTKEGMEAARKGRAEIKSYRVALEKTRKEIKESALRRCQVIDAEARAKREAEEARLAAERAEIERQRAELAKAEEARKAAEAEARRKIEEEERAARMRIEEQERQARLAREEEERKARQAREAEEARLRAERQRIEDERRAAEEKARKEREAEEARLREIERQKAELLDGRDMLATFVRRFGHRAEFSTVAASISEFLQTEAVEA